MDDVRKMIYGTLIGFLLVIASWLSFLFVVGCAGSLDCSRSFPTPERTSIASLVPGTLPAPQLILSSMAAPKCQVGTMDLISAWVGAGSSEKTPFDFTDARGVTCSATFQADVQPLFKELNVWSRAAQACETCHKADVTKASAGLDLTSYQGLMLGSHRTDQNAKGNDILGGGVWTQSVLYQTLSAHGAVTLGHPADMPAGGPLVYAGTPKGAGTATPSPTP